MQSASGRRNPMQRNQQVAQQLSNVLGLLALAALGTLMNLPSGDPIYTKGHKKNWKAKKLSKKKSKGKKKKSTKKRKKK